MAKRRLMTWHATQNSLKRLRKTSNGFDAHARRELAKAMLNAMERIIAADYGKKPPSLYKVKIPGGAANAGS